MTKLKNITNASVTLQMYNIPAPIVNSASVDAVLTLQPGQVIDESTITVNDVTDTSYNADIINDFITDGVLTRIP
jgi:hypothetical protein